jgi:hypothetical protein
MNQYEFICHLKQFTRVVEGIERLVNAVMDHELAVIDGDLPDSVSLFEQPNMGTKDDNMSGFNNYGMLSYLHQYHPKVAAEVAADGDQGRTEAFVMQAVKSVTTKTKAN